MHEIGIMQAALDLALEKAKASSASQIHWLRVRGGVMTGVVPEALQFAFEALREGTLAADAELQIETVSAAGWCAECACEFESVEWFQPCPKCGRSSSQLRRGLELELASMEVS